MAGEYYNQHHNCSNNSDQTPPLPFHLYCFLAILFLFLGLSWYLSYEPVVESLLDNVKMIVLLLPVILLLALHCLSGVDRRWVPFVVPLPESDTWQRGDGSPWGVAMVLVLLIFLVCYKSSFREMWLPLISK